MREALLDPTPAEADGTSPTYSTSTGGYDLSKPTPYDDDAT